MPTLEVCANCGDTIGKLETPHIWNDEVVCGKCIEKLQSRPRPKVGVDGGGPSKARLLVAGGVLLIVVVGGLFVWRFLPHEPSAPAYTIAAPATRSASPSNRPTTPPPAESKNKLPPLLHTIVLDQTVWDWRFKSLEPKNAQEREARRVRSPAVKAAEYGKWFTPDSLSLNQNERTFITSRAAAMQMLISGIPKLYGDADGFLDGLPVRAVDVDGEAGVIVTRCGIDTVYNTLRLEEKARAGKTIKEVVLPQLEAMAGHAEECGVKWVGIEDTYYTQDFSKEYLGADGEQVMVVSPYLPVQDYSAGKITAEELLGKSKIFLNDGHGFRLIAPVLP